LEKREDKKNSAGFNITMKKKETNYMLFFASSLIFLIFTAQKINFINIYLKKINILEQFF